MLAIIKNRRSIRTYIDKPVGYSKEENVFVDKFGEDKIHRNRFI